MRNKVFPPGLCASARASKYSGCLPLSPIANHLTMFRLDAASFNRMKHFSIKRAVKSGEKGKK
jgi:hypothetical protein